MDEYPQRVPAEEVSRCLAGQVTVLADIVGPIDATWEAVESVPAG